MSRAAQPPPPVGLSSPPRVATGPVDAVLAAAVIGLIGFGIVMVFSASAVTASAEFGDAFYYLKRQAVFAALAVALMLGVSTFDYRRLRSFTYPILLAVTAALVAVLFVGHTGGGAVRWLRLGPIHVQPSEPAKLALILWLAYSLEKKRELVKTFKLGMLPHLLLAGFLMALCLKQPDFGGAVMLGFLTFTLLFVAGARLGYLLGVVVLSLPVAYWAVRFKAYRWERILAWLDMSEHRGDLAYQPFQAVMSFGSGQWTGLGLGRGLQVLYLPESHTDFISAIIGEELGFVGLLCLVGVYLLIVARGVRIALGAPDDFGMFVAFGIAVLFGAQALVNLSVAMSILPTKGLTLPLVSYGGSSLVVNAAALGVLLNVSRRRAPPVNERVSDGLPPEASAVVVTEAAFGAGRVAPSLRAQRRREA